MKEKYIPKNKKMWTEETVREEALKYSSRRDFRQLAVGAYAFASRENMLDEICTHMIKVVASQKRDEDSLKAAAQEYTTLTEFRKHDSNAYNAARKKGILEYVCSHMEGHEGARKKPLKKLCKMTKRELEKANEGRVKIGLKPLEIKIRTCLVCKKEFESIGDRTCGCSKASTARLTGFDVI